MPGENKKLERCSAWQVLCSKLIVIYSYLEVKVAIFIIVVWLILTKRSWKTAYQYDPHFEIRDKILSRNLTDCSFKVVSKNYGMCKDVFLSTHLCKGSRTGGEKLDTVMGQSEEMEYFQFDKGFMNLGCSKKNKPAIPNIDKEHVLSRLKESIAVVPMEMTREVLSETSAIFETVVMVERREYVNLFYTMCELFNTFIAFEMFHLNENTTSVFLIDAHPEGALDALWYDIFKHVYRFGHQKNKTNTIFIETLIVSNMGWFSPIRIQPVNILYLDKFQQNILSSYGLDECASVPNCEKLRIRFLARHDRIYHPRSKGIGRRTSNEQELIEVLEDVFPYDDIKALNFDSIPFSKQLYEIRHTDILISMHGAALTHVLFMPPYSALLEIRIPGFSHDAFEALAAEARVYHKATYINASSDDIELPVIQIVQVLKTIIDKICSRVTWK
ncbi:uncharacterized protein LOC102800701 [Saccoglossus kowalevskii]|uniref:EGF domain-specific O-linked N-acetylglucosamine transferase n=1 Tax=Saccoglossus kowalevskii TaxID=10224 RepID=A0ABM0M5H8_SACKO|nr:PREDICTED: uncharacterized protein LOC102800701 [Saccoglossus kowalevskii]